jgi:uncharacterized membrane protein YtjA (UPF0391 family)
VTVKGIASRAAATTLFARSKNPSLELIAKIGYAARGIVFMLIGLFAVFAAIGSRKHVVGNKGALVAVLAEPFGNVMLAVIAFIAALLGFGGVASAAVDIAKIIFFIAILLFAIAVIAGAIGGRRSVL